MTRRSPATLRVAPPTLEPGPVLLHQLVELSASSSPAVRTARRAAVRALAGAATVAVIGGTTWVAGAATGLGPRHAQRPTSSVTSTGEAAVGTPQSDGADSAPGSLWSPRLPGTNSSAPPAVRTPIDRRNGTDHADDPGGRGGQVGEDADGHPGEAKHLAKGHAKDHGNGHAYGHDKTPPGHDATPPGHSEGHGQEHGKGHDKGHGHSSGHGKGHGKGHHGHHGVSKDHHPEGRGRH